jgi:hypothetical protein
MTTSEEIWNSRAGKRNTGRKTRGHPQFQSLIGGIPNQNNLGNNILNPTLEDIMKSNIYELFKSAPTDKAAIAKVLEAEDGQATVVDLGGTPCPVAGHLSQVEALKEGDRILTIHTPTGIIVAGRLRATNEAPTPRLEEQDGRLLVEAPKSVRLQAGENWIEVHADGRIELDGRQITGMAEGRLRLQGSTIELN